MTDIRPAWSEPFLDGESAPRRTFGCPVVVTAGGRTATVAGTGVRVAVVDSGIDADTPGGR